MSVGLYWPYFYSKRLDCYLNYGQKKEFTNSGPFANYGLGYYSQTWELNLDLEYTKETQTNGSVLTPFTIEIGVSRQFSNKLFTTLSFQSIQETSFSIFSTFFKLGYRFGKKQLPPLRDGAPPRGRF